VQSRVDSAERAAIFVNVEDVRNAVGKSFDKIRLRFVENDFNQIRASLFESLRGADEKSFALDL
jgi:hypothetical protein